MILFSFTNLPDLDVDPNLVESSKIFFYVFAVTDNKAELKASLWRIPPLDDTEPPVNQNEYGSPISGGQHAASLNKLCDFNGEHKNIRK